MLRIGIVADFNPDSETHAATERAALESGNALSLEVGIEWLGTDSLSEEMLAAFDALVISTGVYKNRENVYAALRHARERHVPALANCGGFQHMILEYAKNVAAIPDAGHAEFDGDTGARVIVPLSCSLRGRQMEISLRPGSFVSSLYGTSQVTEQYYCSFGVNPQFVEQLVSAGLDPVGSDSEGTLRVTELPAHPFYIGTLFVPQVRSTPVDPHPLVSGLLVAAAKRKLHRPVSMANRR